MQRRKHSILADDCVTDFPCTSPRQFTQKFKSWHLHKNERRKAERKPRCTASIYRNGNGPLGGHQSPGSVIRMVTTGATLTPPDNQSSDHQHAGIKVQLDPMFEDPFLPNQILGMNSAGMNDVMADGPREAVEPRLPIASSAINAQDDSGISENSMVSLSRDWGPSEAIGFPKAVIEGTTSDGASPDFHHGRHLTASEPTERIPSYPEYARNMLGNLQTEREKKRQSSLILAIWERWDDGDFSQIEPLLNTGEYGINMAMIRRIDWKLRKWTSSYPRPCGNPDLQSEGHLPPFDLDYPGTSILTWRAYVEYGYTIASQKKRMTHVEGQAYVGGAAGRLVAAMLLDPSGIRTVRQSFLKIFNEIEPILKGLQFNLQTPCQRFVKYFYFPSSDCKERNPTGHDEQRREAAMLALACARELKACGIYSTLALTKSNVNFQSGTMRSERPLVWAARLLLYYASPELVWSPLPHHLCARALNGYMQISSKMESALYRNKDGSKGDRRTGLGRDQLEDAKFAAVWAEWICCDSDFFLHNHERNPEVRID